MAVHCVAAVVSLSYVNCYMYLGTMLSGKGSHRMDMGFSGFLLYAGQDHSASVPCADS